MFFSTVTFVFPYFFLLFGVLVGILLFCIFRKKKGVHLSSFSEIKQAYKRNSFYYYDFFGALFIIFALFIVLLANPKEFNIKETNKKNGIDIAIVFDISFSMEAADLLPTRLEVAKKTLRQFLSSLTSDRVGLVVFAGRPFASIPMSFDYPFIEGYVGDITTALIDQRKNYLQGTAIGDALVLATKTLEDDKNQEREKIIILMTDGEANTGVNPTLALKLLKDKKIKTYTIGVGGLEKTSVRTLDAFGRPQNLEIGGIDEETLKKIAFETDGKYFRATSEDAMQEIFQEIEKLEKKEVVVEQQIVERERYFEMTLLITLFYIGVLWLFAFKNIRP